MSERWGGRGRAGLQELFQFAGGCGTTEQRLWLSRAAAPARRPCPSSCPADEQLDAAYEEVDSVVSIGRGVGAWGDMVVTLRDGSKIEMRSLPR